MSHSKTTRPFALLRIDNKWVTTFPVSPFGFLRLAPAEIEVKVRFSLFSTQEDSPYIPFTMFLEIADTRGECWEARLPISPNCFLKSLIDLSRPEPAHFEDQACPEWRIAFQNRCLIEGIRDFSDDRFYRHFIVDDRVLILIFKYLSPNCDIAQLDDRTLLARVSGIWGAWNPHFIPGLGRGNFDEEEKDGDDVDEYPSILFPIQLSDLLSSSTVFRRAAGYWAGCSELPLPLVFERLASRGKKQKAVNFESEPTTAVASAESTSGKEFLPIEMMNAEDPATDREVTFQTNEGGRLRITTNSVRGAFRLSIKEQQLDRSVLSCRFRLADSTGMLWEAESLITPDAFLQHQYDLKRGNTPRLSRGRSRSLPLLTDIRDTINDGKTRILVLENEVLVIRFSWQRLNYDVYPIRSVNNTSLLVCMKGLTANRYPCRDVIGERFMEVDVKGENVGEESVVQTLYFEVSPRDLMFRNTTHAVDDGSWHYNDLPIPLVFQRVRGKGLPQPGVEYRSHDEKEV